jgi:hypothetical protein
MWHICACCTYALCYNVLHTSYMVMAIFFGNTDGRLEFEYLFLLH